MSEALALTVVSVAIMFLVSHSLGSCKEATDEKFMKDNYGIEFTCKSDSGVPVYNDLATAFFSNHDDTIRVC